MTAREDAELLMQEFSASWREFKSGLKGREFDNRALVWTMFTSQASLMIFKEGDSARSRTEDGGS